MEALPIILAFLVGVPLLVIIGEIRSLRNASAAKRSKMVRPNVPTEQTDSIQVLEAEPVGTAEYWNDRAKQESEAASKLETEALSLSSSRRSKRYRVLATKSADRAERFSELAKRVAESGTPIPPPEAETEIGETMLRLKNHVETGGEVAKKNAKVWFSSPKIRVRFILTYLAVQSIWFPLALLMYGDPTARLFLSVFAFLGNFAVSIGFVKKLGRDDWWSFLGVVPLGAIFLLFLPEGTKEPELAPALSEQ